MAGAKQGRHNRSRAGTKQTEKHYRRSRLCWGDGSSKAEVVRHPCLARSTTSATIILSVARTDERNGGLNWKANRPLQSPKETAPGGVVLRPSLDQEKARKFSGGPVRGRGVQGAPCGGMCW